MKPQQNCGRFIIKPKGSCTSSKLLVYLPIIHISPTVQCKFWLFFVKFIANSLHFFLDKPNILLRQPKKTTKKVRQVVQGRNRQNL